MGYEQTALHIFNQRTRIGVVSGLQASCHRRKVLCRETIGTRGGHRLRWISTGVATGQQQSQSRRLRPLLSSPPATLDSTSLCPSRSRGCSRCVMRLRSFRLRPRSVIRRLQHGHSRYVIGHGHVDPRPLALGDRLRIRVARYGAVGYERHVYGALCSLPNGLSTAPHTAQ